MPCSLRSFTCVFSWNELKAYWNIWKSWKLRLPYFSRSFTETNSAEWAAPLFRDNGNKARVSTLDRWSGSKSFFHKWRNELEILTFSINLHSLVVVFESLKDCLITFLEYANSIEARLPKMKEIRTESLLDFGFTFKHTVRSHKWFYNPLVVMMVVVGGVVAASPTEWGYRLYIEIRLVRRLRRWIEGGVMSNSRFTERCLNTATPRAFVPRSCDTSYCILSRNAINGRDYNFEL